ncbi:MAG: peptidylprolyl isomerase [Acetobacteraceae bacterium]|nr:peptidylprolyl isomerase [Acetobacteraceae bacterium]
MRSPHRLAFALLLLSGPALAQGQTSPAPSAPAPPSPAPAGNPAPESTPAPTTNADTVIAKVGNEELHASDLADAAQGLPEELRGLPPNMLYPMLLDQLVDRRVIVQEAKKQGLQNDPAVQRAIARASDTVLQNALLTRDIAPTLTDDAIKARYEKDYAGKPGEEEVRAAHILVPDEAKAKDIIAQLDKGADFAALAKANSTDPSAAQNSGELGWFKKADMLPEFSEAAFALQPGEITKTPVHTRFGWHVVKLEERRTAPPPPFEQVRDEIRQQMIQEGVQKVLAQARQGVEIQKFNQDGTPMAAAPAAGTPGAAPASPAPAPAK